MRKGKRVSYLNHMRARVVGPRSMHFLLIADMPCAVPILPALCRLQELATPSGEVFRTSLSVQEQNIAAGRALPTLENFRAQQGPPHAASRPGVPSTVAASVVFRSDIASHRETLEPHPDVAILHIARDIGRGFASTVTISELPPSYRSSSRSPTARTPQWY